MQFNGTQKSEELESDHRFLPTSSNGDVHQIHSRFGPLIVLEGGFRQQRRCQSRLRNAGSLKVSMQKSQSRPGWAGQLTECTLFYAVFGPTCASLRTFPDQRFESTEFVFAEAMDGDELLRIDSV